MIRTHGGKDMKIDEIVSYVISTVAYWELLGMMRLQGLFMMAGGGQMMSLTSPIA
jgi:hypothetical protein